MKNSLIAGLATGLLMLGMVGGAAATPVQWTGSGANNHWYDVVTTTSAITWEKANTAAISSGWHLVTLTSLAEDNFVSSVLDSQRGNVLADSFWLGGYQPDSQGKTTNEPDPKSGWSWVTGETWGYTRWNAVEPNNGVGGTQHYLHYWPTTATGWDDMENRNTMIGYVIESSSPVPEPATVLLFGTGLAGLAGVARRKKKD